MRDPPEDEVCPRCQRCERWRTAPDYFRDPMILWDRFPCPPPGTDHARLLIELDWTGTMGTKAGCEALQRVAKRCHVDLKTYHSLPSSFPDCEELFEAGILCGTNCFIAFILAGICVLFCLLLVLVCVRYVRREKQSSAFCTKVLSSKSADANTHINKEYAQRQDTDRLNGIPQRRGLPYEARATNSGVEARLLKAIQENQLQHYNTDDLCSLCLAESRQSTLQCRRNRLGYEIIYWKDGQFFVKRVPSNETINRAPCSRDSSAYGSSTNGSHHYEYIGDHHTDCSYSSTRRSSNHSGRFYMKNGSQNEQSTDNPSGGFVAVSNVHETAICGSVTDHYANCRTQWKPSRSSVTSLHSRYQDRYQDVRYCTDKVSYQPGGSDKGIYQKSSSDIQTQPNYYSDTTSETAFTCTELDIDQPSSDIKDTIEQIYQRENTEGQNLKAIKGYKYVFNPSWIEDSNNTDESSETLGLRNLQNELFEIETFSSPESNVDTFNNQKRNEKHRKTSTCSNSTNISDSASISGHSSRLNETTLPRRNFSNFDTKCFT